MTNISKLWMRPAHKFGYVKLFLLASIAMLGIIGGGCSDRLLTYDDSEIGTEEVDGNFGGEEVLTAEDLPDDAIWIDESEELIKPSVLSFSSEDCQNKDSSTEEFCWPRYRKDGVESDRKIYLDCPNRLYSDATCNCLAPNCGASQVCNKREHLTLNQTDLYDGNAIKRGVIPEGQSVTVNYGMRKSLSGMMSSYVYVHAALPINASKTSGWINEADLHDANKPDPHDPNSGRIDMPTILNIKKPASVKSQKRYKLMTKAQAAAALAAKTHEITYDDFTNLKISFTGCKKRQENLIRHYLPWEDGNKFDYVNMTQGVPGNSPGLSNDTFVVNSEMIDNKTAPVFEETTVPRAKMKLFMNDGCCKKAKILKNKKLQYLMQFLYVKVVNAPDERYGWIARLALEPLSE